MIVTSRVQYISSTQLSPARVRSQRYLFTGHGDGAWLTTQSFIDETEPNARGALDKSITRFDGAQIGTVSSLDASAS